MGKNKKVIIGIIAGILCIALAFGGLAVYKLINSPQRILLTAAANLTGEIEAAAKDISEQPDYATLLQMCASGDYKLDYNITMKNGYFKEETTLDGKCDYDTTNKCMNSTNKVALNGKGLVNMDFYVEQDKMYILYPDLINGSFIVPMEEYSEGLFQKPSDEMTDTAGIAVGFGKDVPELMKDARIEAVEGVKGSYRITIPKDSAAKIINEKQQLLSDLVFVVKVEQGKNISEITNVDTPLQIEEIGDVTIDILFRRDEEGLTATEMIVNASETSLDYTYRYADGNCDVAAEYETEQGKAKLSFWGKVTGGEDKITLNIDGMRMHLNDEMIMAVDGLVNMMPLDEPIQKPDTEPEYDLLNMTTEDYMELFGQIGDKIYDLF